MISQLTHRIQLLPTKFTLILKGSWEVNGFHVTRPIHLFSLKCLSTDGALELPRSNMFQVVGKVNFLSICNLLQCSQILHIAGESKNPILRIKCFVFRNHQKLLKLDFISSCWARFENTAPSWPGQDDDPLAPQQPHYQRQDVDLLAPLQPPAAPLQPHNSPPETGSNLVPS